MTLSRKSMHNFLMHRSRRLIIPFITTALTLNVIQLEIQAHYQYSALSEHPNFATDLSWYASGQWMEHLWFLNILFQMCLIATSITIVMDKIPYLFSHKFWSTKQITKILMFGALSYVFVVALNGKLPDTLRNPQALGMVDIPVLMFYLPFFGFGMWLHRSESALESFGRLQLASAGVGLLLVVMMLIPESSSHIANMCVRVFRSGLTCWWMCHLCFCSFRLLTNAPSRYFRYFSDASYTIFLFHHLFIVVFAIVLIPISISIFAKFVIMSVASLSLSLLIYEYGIRRNSLLSFLYNGNDYPVVLPVAQTAGKAPISFLKVECNKMRNDQIITSAKDSKSVSSETQSTMASHSL
ncbi:glucans biosynthesis protein [Rubinisphaera italica]|uniref:Glucans biosynthesis protein n=2 Tax=Rubinisphaera italica TaxID=2527969 RepID=A0A5C5XEX7_9PLAN|nr:glucans biosynthesis protein [Rubinisphaera italica]